MGSNIRTLPGVFNDDTGLLTGYRDAKGVERELSPLGTSQGAQVIAGVPARVSGTVLVAALGDSITFDSYSATAAAASYKPHGYMMWAMGMSMGALWCPFVATPGSTTPLLNYNRGVGGETAAQTRARVPELDTLPVKPRFCVILTGTNSVGGTVTPATADSIAADITGTADDVLLRGITPVLCTILPRGNVLTSGVANGWSALSTTTQVKTAKGLLLEVNRLLRLYAANTPGVILADTFYSILDYTTAWSDPVSTYTGRTTATPDYLHPCIPGAILIGKAVWEAIKPFVAPPVRQAAGTGDTWDATFVPYGSMFDSSMSANGGVAGTGISAAAAWAGTTAYVVNNVVTSGGYSYRCAVAGTSGSVAPTFTKGQGLDGTVVWEILSLSAAGGTPSNLTANRVTGASATADILTQARADGLVGNEEVFSMHSTENASFRSYLTTGGSVFPNGNFTLGDVLMAEMEVDVDCGSALYYLGPDLQLKWTGSAAPGAYTVNMALGNGTTHVAGKFSVLLRTPLIDSGLSTALTTGSFWSLCGARSGGAGNVLTTIRNITLRKYNKAAAGALTWTAAP